MRRLIVNADDLGISEAANRGILESHRRGIVTSASMLATGRAFPEAVERTREAPGLDVGLHFNLSEGRPIVDGHKTLVDAGGGFLGKQEARERARTGGFDPSEVESEADEQLRKLKAAGVPATHIDGHQQIHIFRCVAEGVARAAARHGIRFVRCPDDQLAPPAPLDGERAAQVEDYRLNAREAMTIYSRSGLRTTDHFGGIGLSGFLTNASLATTLRALREGLTELMVHPGYAEGTGGFRGPARERELEALTDPAIATLLRDEGIGLTHFGKL